MVPEGERSFEMMTTMTTGDVMVVLPRPEKRWVLDFTKLDPSLWPEVRGGREGKSLIPRKIEPLLEKNEVDSRNST